MLDVEFKWNFLLFYHFLFSFLFFSSLFVLLFFIFLLFLLIFLFFGCLLYWRLWLFIILFFLIFLLPICLLFIRDLDLFFDLFLNLLSLLSNNSIQLDRRFILGQESCEFLEILNRAFYSMDFFFITLEITVTKFQILFRFFLLFHSALLFFYLVNLKKLCGKSELWICFFLCTCIRMFCSCQSHWIFLAYLLKFEVRKYFFNFTYKILSIDHYIGFIWSWPLNPVR